MKKLVLISAVLVVIGALVVSCAKEKAPSEIRVGVVQAQTGMFAAFGQGGVFGIKAAVDDVNKQGGVKVGDTKMLIKLVVVDNESDPNKAGSLAENLINQEKVQFIISGDEPPPMHAGVSMAADRYKVPYVTSVGPLEPWMGMRQETPTKWQYTWATGLFAIDTPATAPDFRAKPGYTVMDTWTAMLDLLVYTVRARNKEAGLQRHRIGKERRPAASGNNRLLLRNKAVQRCQGRNIVGQLSRAVLRSILEASQHARFSTEDG
jgi:branched-chain amino acid transport system substrate-binding protein